MNDLIDIDARPFVLAEVTGHAEMVDGKPVFFSDKWLPTLARMVGRGDIRLSIMAAKKARSLRANNYLWVVYHDFMVGLRQIAAETGERCPWKDEDELHEAMKYIHLGVNVTRFAGVDVEGRATTTTLTPAQFADYVRNVKAMAAERWRIYIREPEDASGWRVA